MSSPAWKRRRPPFVAVDLSADASAPERGAAHWICTRWLTFVGDRAVLERSADGESLFVTMQRCRMAVWDARGVADVATTATVAAAVACCEIRERLVADNVGLAWSSVRVFAARHGLRRTDPRIDDCLSLACDGLIRSVDAFDPARGYRFSTYAVNSIHRRLSRDVLGQKGRTRHPVPTEWTTDHADRIVAPEPDDDDPGPTAAERAQLDAALGMLGERERTIILARHGIGLARRATLEELGTQFGITKEAVRQIQNKALAKMRAVSGYSARG